MEATIQQVHGTVSVDCKRVAIHPCALDEYEVTIKSNGTEQVIYTLGSLFESDEAICNRVYKQWLKEQI